MSLKKGFVRTGGVGMNLRVWLERFVIKFNKVLKSSASTFVVLEIN